MKLYLDLTKAVQIPNASSDPESEEQAIESYNNSFKTRHRGVAAGEVADPDTEEVGKKWQGSKEVDTDGVPGNKKGVSKAQPFDGGFTLEETKRAVESLGVDISSEKYSLQQLQEGMNHEREHGDVTQAGEEIAQIAITHLEESPDYYEKIQSIEKAFLTDDGPAVPCYEEGISILKSISGSLEAARKAYQPNPTEVSFLLEQGYTVDEIMKGQVCITGRLRGLFQDWLCDRMAKSVNSLVGLVNE